MIREMIIPKGSKDPVQGVKKLLWQDILRCCEKDPFMLMDLKNSMLEDIIEFYLYDAYKKGFYDGSMERMSRG